MWFFFLLVAEVEELSPRLEIPVNHELQHLPDGQQSGVKAVVTRRAEIHER